MPEANLRLSEDEFFLQPWAEDLRPMCGKGADPKPQLPGRIVRMRFLQLLYFLWRVGLNRARLRFHQPEGTILKERGRFEKVKSMNGKVRNDEKLSQSKRGVTIRGL